MRERSYSGMVRGVGVTLLLSLALSGDPAVRAVRAHAAPGARAQQVRGDHQVSALAGPRGAELALKDGFALRARVRAGEPSRPLSLRVAEARASAAQIAPEFVPIGPSVVASGAGLRADVSYRADSFRVRRGHRLVLAREREAGCAPSQACWELFEAAYEDSRCVARDVPLRGQRLQFGSVPVSAASSLVRSAAR